MQIYFTWLCEHKIWNLTSQLFNSKSTEVSHNTHASLRAGPAHGFMTVAPSLASGPVCCNLAAIRSLWPVLLLRLFEDWNVTALRLSRSSSLGALNQWQQAAMIEGVNGQMRCDDGLSSCPSMPPEYSVQSQVTEHFSYAVLCVT